MYWFVRRTLLGLCKHSRAKVNISGSPRMGSSWKDSSSIIIVAKSSLQEAMGTNLSDFLMRNAKTNISVQQKYDYRILLLKRNANSSFMANAYVFPGGIVELSDYSTKWWDVFNNSGFSNDHVMQLPKSIQGPRPPICTSVTLADANLSEEYQFPPELALRISAIRETFEETGVLLLTSFDCQEVNPLICASSKLDTEAWRKKVCKDPSAFIDLCLSVNLCPHIWCLHEWWNWLTPSIGHRRYDTMFYVCCLPKVPEIRLNEDELTESKWFTPNEILNELTIGKLFLPPPQAYETSRFLNFYHFQDLKNFAKQRECKGVERWMNIISSTTDGTVALSPGDDMYPTDVDPNALFKYPKYPHTRLHLRNATRNLNRTEINGQIIQIFCNMVPPCGHVQPLSHSSKSQMAHSHL